MGTKYKCRVCHATVDSDYAFQSYTAKGKPFYCCSQSEYVKYIIERNKENQVKEYTYRALGEKTSNGQLYKEIGEWHSIYSWDRLIEYFEESIDRLESTMRSKEFKSIYSKIRYLSTVVKNTIDDVKPKTIEEKMVKSASEFVEPVTSAKTKRRGLANIDV